MAQEGTPVAVSGSSTVNGQDQRFYGASVGRWSGYVRELFSSPNGPPLGSVDVDKIEEAAREKLKDSPGMSLQLRPMSRCFLVEALWAIAEITP